jgi:hypothetical protein
MDLKRGALRSTVSRLQAEGRLNRGWHVEQAVDVLDVLLSVETYQRLVTERCWKQEEFVQRVHELCARAVPGRATRQAAEEKDGEPQALTSNKKT